MTVCVSTAMTPTAMPALKPQLSAQFQGPGLGWGVGLLALSKQPYGMLSCRCVPAQAGPTQETAEYQRIPGDPVR